MGYPSISPTSQIKKPNRKSLGERLHLPLQPFRLRICFGFHQNEPDNEMTFPNTSECANPNEDRR